VASQAAEEDPAQRQKSKRLPEGNLAPAEERRQQPIPQKHYDSAADSHEEKKTQQSYRGQENPSLSHLGFLTLS
jgi:hypothetical protein